jgi:hypothetical protein
MTRITLYCDDISQVFRIFQFPEIEVLRTCGNGTIDVIIDDDHLAVLHQINIPYEITVSDLAAHYQELRADARGGVFGNYYLYSEVRDAILTLQSQYSSIVKVDSLPTRSIEDRALYTVKISNSPGANNGKPEALFSGAIHAYEPIGVSVCMTDMMHLCENYTGDPETRWLVDNRQIYFIPVMNPDGYVFNETYPSMMWRKNRRDNGGGSFGVDLNRNYPYKWGYDNNGSSGNPSAWNYRGTAPASEPETQAVVDFVNGQHIRTWHNHHSPGDVLLIPFSYINSYPWDDTLEYYTICREESLLYGFVDWGNSTQAYGYPCNGELGDWAWCDSATYKIFGLVPELGPDYWGGLNDTNEIVDICQRMLNAELYLMEIAGYFPTIDTIAVIDTFPGANNDGVLNPGESANLVIRLYNKAVVDTGENVTGLLSTSHQFVTVTDSTGTYGDMLRLSSASNNGDPYEVSCNPAIPPYEWIPFVLGVQWDNGAYEKFLPCSLQIGPQTSISEHHSPYQSNPLVLQTISPGGILFNPLRTTQSMEVTIYNSIGARIHQHQHGDRSVFVKLPPGVYFVTQRAEECIVKIKCTVLPSR